jgi:hypothetical protein
MTMDVPVWSDARYGAAALSLIGLWLVLAGLTRVPRRAQAGWGWPDWALAYLYVFRRVIVGLCLVGAAVGWAADVSWLLWASVCVGVGELLESSYYIGVLRWGQRRGAIAVKT